MRHAHQLLMRSSKPSQHAICTSALEGGKLRTKSTCRTFETGSFRRTVNRRDSIRFRLETLLVRRSNPSQHETCTMHISSPGGARNQSHMQHAHQETVSSEDVPTHHISSGGGTLSNLVYQLSEREISKPRGDELRGAIPNRTEKASEWISVLTEGRF